MLRLVSEGKSGRGDSLVFMAYPGKSTVMNAAGWKNADNERSRSFALMKNDENLRTISVVMLISSREGRDLVECYQMGTNAYVVKPVDSQQFVQAMKHLGAFRALVNERPRQFHSLPAGHPTERLP